MIAISALIYLTLIPISFLHQKLKTKSNEKIQDNDDNLEDVLMKNVIVSLADANYYPYYELVDSIAI